MAEECKVTLLNKKYHENCPGCKLDEKKQLERGFPIWQLCTIWIVVLSSCMTISSLFPFIYFMVDDFKIAKKKEDIGFYAGFVGCSFMVGRTFTSAPWGMLSDRYGRKPAILLATAFVVIFNTLFGLSTNFWMAVITRFCLGTLNGIIGPVRAYAVELFPDQYKSLALSSVSAAWGIGMIVGPALGGYLAQPAEKYPNIFSKESFFGRFPYFLPCFVISLFALIVTIICFWIPETLHNHKIDDASSSSHDEPDASAEKGEERSLLRNWQLMSSVFSFCIFSLHDIAYVEIFSLWANSPIEYGGLGYSTADVGSVLTITGCGLLIFQLSLYPVVERLIGPTNLIRGAGVLTIIILSLLPLTHNLHGFAQTLAVNAASMGKNVLAASILTGIYVLQNSYVSQHQRGQANGISMTGMSIAQAIGPAVAGIVFSWCQKRQDAAFIPGTPMIFFILNVVVAIATVSMFNPLLSRAV